MKLFVITCKKKIEWEGDEITNYFIISEDGYAAMRHVDSIYKVGTGNLDFTEIPDVYPNKDINVTTVVQIINH